MLTRSQAERAEGAGRIWRGITIPPGKAQAFEIRLYDTVLAAFEARVDRFGVRTFKLEPPAPELVARLPFAIAANPSDGALVEWLRTRTVPRHQKYAKEILRSAGIDPDDLMGQVSMSLGLSLNDAYWVAPAGLGLAWDEVNLFTNDNRDVLSLVAYTGELVDTSQQSLLSTSWGTGGSFAKAWRVGADGRLVLYKAGSDFPAANSGQEPWSEFVASQAAAACDIPHVSYGLAYWKGRRACTCELLNNERVALVPSYQVVGSGTFYSILAAYRALGAEAFEAFRDMVAFDALICNTDRHGANYAFLRDNRSGRLCGLAPLFDHNLALFVHDMPTDYPQWRDATRPYVDDLCRPAGHEMTFDQQAQIVLGDRQRAMVARVLDIRLLNAEGSAAVPPERLAAWEEFLHARAARLLGTPELSEDELEELVTEQRVAREDLAPIRLGLMPADLKRLWPHEISRLVP